MRANDGGSADPSERQTQASDDRWNGSSPGWWFRAVLIAVAVLAFLVWLGLFMSPSADFETDLNDGPARGIAGEMTVTHDGGDRFSKLNTGKLVVLVEDSEQRIETEFRLPVGTDDRVTVPVSGGDTVRVVWVGPLGLRQRTLHETSLPVVNLESGRRSR